LRSSAAGPRLLDRRAAEPDLLIEVEAIAVLD
jgi:hypothetical protein